MTAAWDAEEAKRRISRARQHGDLPGNQLSDQLEAAGVEIERLTRHMEAGSTAAGSRLQENASLTAEHNAKLDAISDALHRAGVGDSPRLVDRIALAGEELHKLRQVNCNLRLQLRAAQTIEAERDSERAAMVANFDTASENCRLAWLAAQEFEAERDSLRQQLEAAQRELASVREVADPDNETPESLRDRVMHVGEQAALLVSVTRIAKERGAARRDLTAAQQRIAELEAERDERVGRLVDGLTEAVTMLEADRSADSLRRRLRQLIRDNKGPRTLTAALRLIAPVYRMMVRWRDQDGISWDEAYGTIDTARARLTPELLAVIEAATK